jgi:hypothetical protein
VFDAVVTSQLPVIMHNVHRVNPVDFLCFLQDLDNLNELALYLPATPLISMSVFLGIAAENENLSEFQ